MACATPIMGHSWEIVVSSVELTPVARRPYADSCKSPGCLGIGLGLPAQAQAFNGHMDGLVGAAWCGLGYAGYGSLGHGCPVGVHIALEVFSHINSHTITHRNDYRWLGNTFVSH